MKAKKIFLIFLFSLIIYPALTHTTPSREVPELFKLFISADPGKIGNSSQILFVTPAKSNLTEVVVYQLEKQGGAWKIKPPTTKGVIGAKGFAFLGQKKEGDKKTPTGIFGLIQVYGHTATLKTKMPYHQATQNDYWVDDPASPQYNTRVRGKPQARNYQRMRMRVDLYKYAIVIEYNMKPVFKGQGSGIFIHGANTLTIPTHGCLGLLERDLMELLSWLDPARKPKIIMGSPEGLKDFIKKWQGLK